MRKPIYLLGFMGSGKSVVGKRLSQCLDFDFIDLDHYIESQAEISINEIFTSKGQKHFRDLEHKCLLEISTKRNVIISLGGGTPCYPKNRKIIGKGTTVYLKSSIASLTDRLFAERQNRPLIKDITNSKSLKTFIRNLLQERKVHYQRAKIKIWNRGTVDNVIQKLEKKLKE